MSKLTSQTPALALGRLIETGAITPRDATEFYLDRIAQTDRDHRIYWRLTEARARAEADAAGKRAKSGLRRHPLDGVPLSWKDLFDTTGTITTGGSLAMSNRVPDNDAAVLTQATASGSICLGKTAMTEIAFSGLGINPTCGTPANAYDETTERAPGGSSSGAAVALARGLCAGSIGTDTGGSVRIPAAWNGLVGLKTTAGRLSLKGTLPLSPTFDTVGPLARDVADANALFSLLSGEAPFDISEADLRQVSLCLPGGVGWSELDEGIGDAVDGALRRLLKAGIRIVEQSLPALDAIDALAWGGGASRLVAEAYARWAPILENHRLDIFSPVYERVMAGAAIPPADLEAADKQRAAITAAYLDQTRDIDVVALPCVAISPPSIASLEQGGPDYFKANRMALRNTTLGNQLGLCAITLPVGHDVTGIPVGLMLQAAPHAEERLLKIASAIEKALRH